MRECPLREKCPHRRLGQEGSRSGRARIDYCAGEPEGCARYLVHYALGPDRVPDDLAPYQHDRARRMIAAG